MVVSRSPQPIRRSPRKVVAADTHSSFTTTQSIPTDPTNEFPSLDEMAAASQEGRARSSSSVSAAPPSSVRKTPSSSTSISVPSSLPRPAAKSMVKDADKDRRDARSSLTTGALERARQNAGDQTPVSVSQARAARAAIARDSTAEPDTAQKQATDHIDVEVQELPKLSTASVPGESNSGYNIDKYLDGDLDPFNRASRKNIRREGSRPLAGLRDEGDESGDTTARGDENGRVDLTPRVQSIKAAASTPKTTLMSPHASPSLSSRKLGQLKTLPSSSSLGDGSIAADASRSRFDPESRSDRLQTMELSELRKKHNATLRELSSVKEKLTATRKGSEGWASECAGLQAQIASLQADMEHEQRTRLDMQLHLAQYKSEVDNRAWQALCQSQRQSQLQVKLGYAKNEALCTESKMNELQTEWEQSKDDLRVRYMIECKRADMLVLHCNTARQATVRLRRRLAASERQNAELVRETKDLTERNTNLLYEISSLQGENDDLDDEVRDLESSLGDLQRKRDHDASKPVKVSSSDLLRGSKISASEKQREAERKGQPTQQAVNRVAAKPAALTKPSAAAVIVEKKVSASSRRPMQGASELGPSSDHATPPAVRTTSAAAIKSKSVPAPAPIVPAPKAKTVSKNWREEVRITDSEEESSEDDTARRQKAKKQTSTKSAGSKKAPVKPKPTVGIEYDDQTADPSATPMIRNTGKNKRDAGPLDDDDNEDEQSVLIAKFGRDKTNLAAAKSKSKAPAPVALPSTDAAKPIKKKRKLIGAGAAGPSSGWSAEWDGLAPNYNIPTELSPVKAATSGAAGGRGLLSGFGMGAPFK